MAEKYKVVGLGKMGPGTMDLEKKELELTYRLRRVLSELNPVEAVEVLKNRLNKCRSNAEFLMTMNID